MSIWILGQLIAPFVTNSSNNYEPRDFADYESNIDRYVKYLQDLNRGVTMSFQANPNDSTTDCYTATTLTNVEIGMMVDAANYEDNEITQNEFTEKF